MATSSSSSSSSLTNIPNSVSGDGTPFVAQLKAVLSSYSDSIEGVNSQLEAVEKILATLTAESITNQVGNLSVTQTNDTTLKLTWDKGTFDDTTVYARAQILMKTATSTGNGTIDWDSIDATVLITADNALSYTISDLVQDYQYQFTVLGVSTTNGKSSQDHAPSVSYYLPVPATPDVIAPTSIQSYYTGYGFRITLTQSDSADYDYTEIRTDTNFGSDNGSKLQVTRGLQTMVYPASRSGTFYVANKKNSTYSNSISITYTAPELTAPTNLMATVKTDDTGTHQIKVQISFNVIPNIVGSHVTVDGVTYTMDASDTVMTLYVTKADNYTVSASYYDVFGDGPTSSTSFTISNSDFTDGIFKNIYATSLGVSAGYINSLQSENITANKLSSSIIVASESITADAGIFQQVLVKGDNGIDTPFIHASNATLDTSTINNLNSTSGYVKDFEFDTINVKTNGTGSIKANSADIKSVNMDVGTTNSPLITKRNNEIPNTYWTYKLIDNYAMNKYPFFWVDRGDGSDGVFSPTTSQTLSGIKNYTKVIIPAGVTITVDGLLWIKCQGTFSNAGTISANGTGFPGGQTVVSGYDEEHHTDENNSWYTYQYFHTMAHSAIPSSGAGCGGGYYGIAIGCRYSYGDHSLYSIVQHTDTFAMGGGGQTLTNYITGDRFSPTQGASGGGCIRITALSITNTGSITADGASVTSGSYATGGGGGGSILLIGDTVSNTGSTSVNGGNGISGGAAGDSGWVLVKEIGGRTFEGETVNG